MDLIDVHAALDAPIPEGDLRAVLADDAAGAGAWGQHLITVDQPGKALFDAAHLMRYQLLVLGRDARETHRSAGSE